MRSDDIGRLLRYALRTLEDDLLRRLAADGYGAVRYTHTAVLRALDEDGTRPGVLAERAGLARQAMTQADALGELAVRT